MQHKIIDKHDLLDDNGYVIESGYANEDILKYNRSQVKINHNFLKEWDYYLIANSSFGVAFSIACLGPITRLTANFMDYKTGEQHTQSSVLSLNTEEFNMPSDVLQSVSFSGSDVNGQYIRTGNKVKIKVDYKNFGDNTLSVDAEIDIPDYDAMVIIVPYKEKKDMFYYNYKLTCMKVSGNVEFGNKIYSYDEIPTYAIYDWGRGIWFSRNTWYWGSANGVVDGNDFAFNIGYGFGDTSSATENMIFWKGQCHKIEEVEFKLDESDYTKPWIFTSSDGRFEMDFVPVLDRASIANLESVGSNQHQVFGNFSGKVILDDGQTININDLFGFAEVVRNNFGPTGITNE